MTGNAHPSSGELVAALHGPGAVASVTRHLDDCLACRVRLSRLRETAGIAPLGPDGLRRVLEASAVLPELIAELATASDVGTPQANEIWRVGLDEALLVWVRQVFDDGAADIVPVVLDTELADEDTILIEANATVLGTETAAVVSLRTHVHLGAFLNRIGSLDITDSVNEVIRAGREARRASGIRTGPPVVDDDDQRLEYRQALRDLLAELSPSAWPDARDDRGAAGFEHDSADKSRPSDMSGINDIAPSLVERLPGLKHHRLDGPTVHIDANVWIVSVLKVSHLDEVVVVATLGGGHGGLFPDVEKLAPACEKLTHFEPDADAVALFILEREWPSLLFTRANMRPAVEVPRGHIAGPTVTLEGFGLVDILSKHFEGATTAWEVTEPAVTRVMTGLSAIASRHAGESVAEVVKLGARAQQPAKRLSYRQLPEDYAERVAEFVVAVASQSSVNDAIAELIAEAGDD